MLESAEGNVDAALVALERARADLEPFQFPLERARTLLGLGSTLRRGQQKRAARDALQQALAIFDELGAPLWAEKTRAELKRISGRSPGPDGLSETEQRVADLAVQGHTNKQIAAELFVSVRTVEAHLTTVYRKLGIRSRSALAAHFVPADGAVKAADDPAKA